MPRANRYFIPGQVWHITHRCHKKEFLLKFQKDRRCWLNWLYEAKKRYGLCVLNYIVTSNHTHLLVHDAGTKAIPNDMQLIAGRTAQQFNQRKKRKGAIGRSRLPASRDTCSSMNIGRSTPRHGSTNRRAFSPLFGVH
jgi:putative transposase